MNKSEIIERIEELYNQAAERDDVVLESGLHDLLVDAGAIEPARVYPTLGLIHNYEVLGQWLIVGSYKVVCLELTVNDGQKAWLTCEPSGGAVVCWYEDPSDSYEDRMSQIWNMTDEANRSGQVGYVTEPAGAFDQWIFPADNIDDDESGAARNAIEADLYQFIRLLANMLC